MSDFVTVLTLINPQELYIIKGRLEAEGIVCFVKDELTVQTNNLYSNAIGGVKLQVQQQDVDQTISFLTELGYIKDEPQKPDLLTRIDAQTSSIPLLRDIGVVNRILVITIIIIVLITALLYFLLRSAS